MNRSVNDSVNDDLRSKPSPRRLNLPLTTKREDFSRAPGRFRKPLTVVVAIYCLANSLRPSRVICGATRGDALRTSPDSLNHSLNHSVTHSLGEGNGREWKGSKEDMARCAWHRDLAIARASRDAMRSDR